MSEFHNYTGTNAQTDNWILEGPKLGNTIKNQIVQGVANQEGRMSVDMWRNAASCWVVINGQLIQTKGDFCGQA